MKTKLTEIVKSGNMVIHTPKEEQAKKLLGELDKRGYTWLSGNKLTDITLYEYYEENTCYATSIQPNGKTYIEYCELSFYTKNAYTIVEFADIDLEN